MGHRRKKSNSTSQLPTYSSASDSNFFSDFGRLSLDAHSATGTLAPSRLQIMHLRRVINNDETDQAVQLLSLQLYPQNIGEIIELCITHSNVNVARFLLEDNQYRACLTKEDVSKIFLGFYDTKLPIQMVQFEAIKDYFDYTYIQNFAREDAALVRAMVASSFYIYQLAPAKITELALWQPALIPGILKCIFADAAEGGSSEIAWIRNSIDSLYAQSLSSRAVIHTVPEYLQKSLDLESTQITVDLLKSLFATDRSIALSILKSAYLLEKIGCNPHLAYAHQTFTACDYQILARYHSFRGMQILASQYARMANVACAFDLNLQTHRTSFILWNFSNPAPFTIPYMPPPPYESPLGESTLSSEPSIETPRPSSPHP